MSSARLLVDWKSKKFVSTYNLFVNSTRDDVFFTSIVSWTSVIRRQFDSVLFEYTCVNSVPRSQIHIHDEYVGRHSSVCHLTHVDSRTLRHVSLTSLISVIVSWRKRTSRRQTQRDLTRIVRSEVYRWLRRWLIEGVECLDRQMILYRYTVLSRQSLISTLQLTVRLAEIYWQVQEVESRRISWSSSRNWSVEKTENTSWDE